MTKRIFTLGLLLAAMLPFVHSQVVLETLTNSRNDVNTRVRALNDLVDSLQAALGVPPIEVMPVVNSGNRGMARLDQRALAQTFQDMADKLGMDIVIPDPPIKPRDILIVVSATLEAASEQPPAVQTWVADEIAEVVATLRGVVTDDGRKALQYFGFKFGADSTLADSILVPFDSIPFLTGDFGDFLDTSAVDTGAFYLAKPDLTPSSIYYFSAWAENEMGISHGDTLSFLTLPGVTTESASDVSDSIATISATIAYGDVTPTTMGLKWGFAADLSDAIDSTIVLAADSTIAWTRNDLAIDSTYYFSAYATNASGTSYGDTLSFVAGASPCGDLESVNYQGYDYALVPLGDNCFFAENLRNINYNDGTPIPSGLSNDEWKNTTEGATSPPDGDEANVAEYGRLYNGFAVETAKLCPTGWQVPTTSEYDRLGSWVAQQFGIPDLHVGKYIKASPSDDPAWNGEEGIDFNALAAGSRVKYPFLDDQYSNFEMSGYFWAHIDSLNQATRYTVYGSSYAFDKAEGSNMVFGNSVRCVLTISGCTNAGYLEYDPLANLDDGSCATVVGCMDPAYYDYNPDAVQDDGSCSILLIPGCGETVTYQGHDYPTVQIGEDCWFTENLQNENDKNGNPIPYAESDSDWATSFDKAQCFYDNNADNGAISGRLYNYFAANSGSLCPTGWKVPSREEVESMGTYIGGLNGAGTLLKASDTDPVAWNGTNDYGFNAIPGGYRTFTGSFIDGSTRSALWTSTMTPEMRGTYYVLRTEVEELGIGDQDLKTAHSVRCIMDISE